LQQKLAATTYTGSEGVSVGLFFVTALKEDVKDEHYQKRLDDKVIGVIQVLENKSRRLVAHLTQTNIQGNSQHD
jgi:hypothetical protein